MLNEKILEFYREFQDEVLNYVKENSPISTNIAFKTLFLSYLTEAGETLVSDCALVDFKKDGENMKLDGYAFSEYFHSLTLLKSPYFASLGTGFQPDCLLPIASLKMTHKKALKM